MSRGISIKGHINLRKCLLDNYKSHTHSRLCDITVPHIHNRTCNRGLGRFSPHLDLLDLKDVATGVGGDLLLDERSIAGVGAVEDIVNFLQIVSNL